VRRKRSIAAAALLVFVIAAISLLGLLQQPLTTWPSELVGTHLCAADVIVRYRQAGRGPDILLLHGSPGSIEDWDPVLDTLAKQFRVTAFDRPGHGFSGGAEIRHTPAENARVARNVMATLGLEHVLVVGHSYGAVTALYLAAAHAPEVRGVVLVGARAYPPVDVAPVFRILALPAFGTGFAAVVAPLIGPGMIESGVRKSFGPNALPPGFIEPRAPIYMRPTVSHALAEERTTLAAALDEMRPRYAGIDTPVTLVCGDHDHPSFEDSERLAREIRGARFAPQADTGHMVQFSRTAELVALITEAARR
jgi:pimeloyl-ACP methyl ester carboxylesterase